MPPRSRRAPGAPGGPPDFSFESALIARGVWPVAGVDEAGRGPLAGPVAAAAVILDPENLPEGLDDSKKLKPARREELSLEILARALAVGVSLAPAAEIDQFNIRGATFNAMRRALRALSLPPARALIDGNALPADLPCPAEAIVRGDSRSISIAAASIVAKVTRDRLMLNLDREYPRYGFARHAGYPVASHRAALEIHGASPFHRVSFAPVRAALTRS